LINGFGAPPPGTASPSLTFANTLQDRLACEPSYYVAGEGYIDGATLELARWARQYGLDVMAGGPFHEDVSDS